MPSQVPLLSGETPASAKQLTDARNAMTAFATKLQQLLDWPHPPSFTVPHTATPIIIDGKVDDPAWKHAVAFTRLYPFNNTKPVATPKTTWRMLWDARYLYVSLVCTDTDIIAPVLPRDGQVFSYDCLEVLLLPDLAKGVYWELEVGATGSIFDAPNIKHRHAWGAEYHPEATMIGLRVATHIDGVPNDRAPSPAATPSKWPFLSTSCPAW